MHYVVCQGCKTVIWKTTTTPQVGKIMDAGDFRGVNGFPDPSPIKAVQCPSCGRMPFVVHNFGIQLLTNEGELLPCLPKLSSAEFLLPTTE